MTVFKSVVTFFRMSIAMQNPSIWVSMLTSGTRKNVAQLGQENGEGELDRPLVMLISVWAGGDVTQMPHTPSKYFLTHFFNFSKVLLATNSPSFSKKKPPNWLPFTNQKFYKHGSDAVPVLNCKAFATSKFNKIVSGWKHCQLVKTHHNSESKPGGKPVSETIAFVNHLMWLSVKANIYRQYIPYHTCMTGITHIHLWYKSAGFITQ